MPATHLPTPAEIVASNRARAIPCENHGVLLNAIAEGIARHDADLRNPMVSPRGSVERAGASLVMGG